MVIPSVSASNVPRWTVLESPIGTLTLVGVEAGLASVGFACGRRPRPPAPEWTEETTPLAEPLRAATEQLRAWFAGELRSFDLTLAPEGTPFQHAVWAGLRLIPYGETVSYAELALRIGRPSASRAVGAANGANPLPIVVPCHRVIGADGTLTGFAGGIETKRWLLAHEAGAAGPTGRCTPLPSDQLALF